MATAHMPDREILDRDQLTARLPALQEQYRAGRPFPHVVVDGLLSDTVAREAFDAFPSPDSGEWTQYKHVNERKIGRSSVESFPDIHRSIVTALGGPFFVDFLSKLTGVQGLFSDPELEGGGLHQTESGGFLSVHTDFGSHVRNPSWSRRVNVLVYFNPDWKQEYGGELELWDPDVNGCVTRVSPILNRCVVFETNARTYHGHPTPLVCDPETTRKSLALYYFTEEATRPEIRSTKYAPRPADSAMQRALIRADSSVVAVYDSLKRRFGFSDRLVSRILNRLFR